MRIPAEILDAITSFVEGPRVDTNNPHQYENLSYDCRKTLSTLRLVNKAFCQSATPRLFKHMIATFRNKSPLTKLRELSSSPHAVYVRRVCVGIDGWSSYSPSPQISIYAEDLSGLLSSCLARFPNMSCLEFLLRDCHKIPQEAKNKMMASVICALRYVDMPALKVLDIGFPIAHDFGQLLDDNAGSSRIPIKNVLRRLERLALHVQEWTSYRGQRYWHQEVTPENAALPNETFAVNIFDLIDLAENIQSLVISCTNILNLDDAAFPSSLRLKYLDLLNVSISADTILGLMKNWRGSIESIQLTVVELNAGTWKHVFVELSQLPALINFELWSCGYSTTGASAKWQLGVLPSSDDPQEIETMNPLDVPALAILQHVVYANRIAAGLSVLPKYIYVAMERYSLESATAYIARHS
ncbi:hypothetical protein V8C35DRAFT_311525 [Trichoderma chlorosporum]